MNEELEIARLGAGEFIKMLGLGSDYDHPMTPLNQTYFWDYGLVHRMKFTHGGVPKFDLPEFLERHDLELTCSKIGKNMADYLLLAKDRSWCVNVIVSDDEIEGTIDATSLVDAAVRLVECNFTSYIISIEEAQTVMRFWVMGGHGMELHTKALDFPEFDSIIDGYPNGVGNALNELVKTTLGDSGNIILFHGPPGTGKTTAIRALANHWKDDVTFNVIVEPDIVFASYSNIYQMKGGNSEEADKKQMFVIEDSDELIREDGKARSGQALAKLLNMTDGLIGQGVDFNVIITTNEPIDKLHPALIRPGRCLADIHFPPLTRKEAEIKFPDKEFTTKEVTLADAFAAAPIRSEKKEHRAGTYL